MPLAGQWAGLLFAFGLLNASLFAASILPLSTAHVICEGLGFEAGLDRKFKEAPTFYSLYTLLIVVGAGIVLFPKAPLWKILIFRRWRNGIWLPVVLIFILLLINRRDLMGDYVNTLAFNVIAWASSIIMIILTFVLVYTVDFPAFSCRPFRIISLRDQRLRIGDRISSFCRWGDNMRKLSLIL